MPCPPPIHKVTIPRLIPSRRMEWKKGVKTAPVAPNWMTMRDRTTLNVDNVLRQAKVLRNGDRNRSESLVDLDALDICSLPTGAFEGLFHGRDWA